MPRSHLSIDSLALITALDYKISPEIYMLPDDMVGIHGNPTDLSSLGGRYYPRTIEDSAVDVMDREKFDLNDFKLQKAIARIAVKYVEGYEQIKHTRQLTADRLNNPVH